MSEFALLRSKLQAWAIHRYCTYSDNYRYDVSGHSNKISRHLYGKVLDEYYFPLQPILLVRV